MKSILSRLRGMEQVSIRIKGRWDNDDDDKNLDSCQPSQADWIKQYMVQQEEDKSQN